MSLRESKVYFKSGVLPIDTDVSRSLLAYEARGKKGVVRLDETIDYPIKCPVCGQKHVYSVTLETELNPTLHMAIQYVPPKAMKSICIEGVLFKCAEGTEFTMRMTIELPEDWKLKSVKATLKEEKADG
ncbi:MAG: hypothetical protein PHQ43_14930 [Dehalococcoidales bacterium]|nr:hypothetical protein [Dehalococcoidales bacterium]